MFLCESWKLLPYLLATVPVHVIYLGGASGSAAASNPLDMDLGDVGDWPAELMDTLASASLQVGGHVGDSPAENLRALPFKDTLSIHANFNKAVSLDGTFHKLRLARMVVKKNHFLKLYFSSRGTVSRVLAKVSTYFC